MEKGEKVLRLEEAVSHLISLNLVDGKAPIKDIADKMNRHKNNVSSALSGDVRYLTWKFIKDFCATFNNTISPYWIWDGKGDMLKTLNEIATENNLHENDTNSKQTKPRLPVSAAAGQLSEYIDGIMAYQCEQMPIIRRLPNYDFTMLIRGNSMEPKYEGGDEIALKKVTIIEWGKDYVVDTEDGAIFKKIYDAGKNIRCVSYNHDEYPDFLVPKSSIYGYYKFVGLIRI